MPQRDSDASLSPFSGLAKAFTRLLFKRGLRDIFISISLNLRQNMLTEIFLNPIVTRLRQAFLVEFITVF
jgi:hypothetical protein